MKLKCNMSLTHNQILEVQLTLAVFTVALVAGASISINPISILEFANDESYGSDVSVIEEIDGDILDPNHPFQVEQRSEELKNTIKKGGKIIIVTEEGTRYVANFPEAGSGPENPDIWDNELSNQPNNPLGNTDPNYVTDSQNPILKNNPLIPIAISKQSDSILDKIQSVMEDSDQSSMEHCTQRGPESDLHQCDFSGANLYGTVLTVADLRSADFSGANLRSAFLRGADFSAANLSSADLRGAFLGDANLEGANLSDTKFSGAILVSDCIPFGKLIQYDLNSDNLYDVNLEGWGYFSNGMCLSIVK